MMDIKVNREIRDYTESVFFGLSLRQFFFSALACVCAVGVYFLIKPVVGTEVISWLCILVALPFAGLGFIKYNGMPAEKIFYAWLKSEVLIPKHLVWGNTNRYCLYLEEAEENLKKKKKEEKRVIKRRKGIRLIPPKQVLGNKSIRSSCKIKDFEKHH